MAGPADIVQLVVFQGQLLALDSLNRIWQVRWAGEASTGNAEISEVRLLWEPQP